MSDERTADLSDVIDDLVTARLQQALTTLPGTVISYNPSEGTVVARPDTASHHGDSVAAFPAVADVPVAWPGGGGLAFTWPLHPGDRVLLLFSCRSLDRWKGGASAGQIDSQRTHALSDAIAIPLAPRPLTAPLDNVPVNDAELRAPTAGNILLGQGATDAVVLLNALSAWLTTSLSVSTAWGPSGPAIAGLTAAQGASKVKAT